MKIRLSFIILSLIMAILWPEASTVWAAPVAQTSDLDCSNSPFGGVLEVGGEREIFVGFRDNDPNSFSIRPMNAFLLDLNSSGAITFDQKKASGLRAKNASATHAAVAVDFNGDGYDEFFQAFVQDNELYRAIVYVNGQGNADLTDTWSSTGAAGIGHSRFATTAGNLQRIKKGNEAVAVLSRNGTNAINVNLYSGNSNGTISQSDGSVRGLWRSKEENTQMPEHLGIANGDLDGDGFDDEIVVIFQPSIGSDIQIRVLEYAANYSSGSGDNLKTNIQEIANRQIPAQDPMNVRVAVGDIDGDFQDEIVVVSDREQIDAEGTSDQLDIRTFEFNPAAAANARIEQRTQQYDQKYTTFNLDLAVADTDRDSNAEIIIGYYGTENNVNDSTGLHIHTLDADSSAATIPYHNSFHDSQNERSRPRDLRIVADDMTKDGHADIIAVFEDKGGQMQIVRLTDSTLPKSIDPSGGITLESAWRSGTAGLDDLRSLPALTVGDWDNDSILAHYEAVEGGSILCKKVTEAQIATAVYMPPNWENIVNKYPAGATVYAGAVGRSTTQPRPTKLLTRLRTVTVSMVM